MAGEATAGETVVGTAGEATAAETAARLQEVRAGLPASLQCSLLPASELGRRRRAELREEPLPTMVAALDELLGGGLPRGALVELVGRRSSGRFSMLLSALKALTDTGEVAALVDLGSQLDPQAAAAVGVELERLLWLRPQWLPDAVSAAEMLVHTGFPLVAVDLGLPPVRGRASQAAWLRLARSTITSRAAVLVASPYRLSGCAAATVVIASRRRETWSGQSAEAAAPQLLHGVATRLSTARRRGHHPGASREVVLDLPEAVAPPPSRDPARHRVHRYATASEVRHVAAS